MTMGRSVCVHVFARAVMAAGLCADVAFVQARPHVEKGRGLLAAHESLPAPFGITDAVAEALRAASAGAAASGVAARLRAAVAAHESWSSDVNAALTARDVLSGGHEHDAEVVNKCVMRRVQCCESI